MTAPALTDSATVVTPTLRSRFASWRFWIALALVLAVVAVLWSLVTGGTGNTTTFGVGNAGPTGGRAVAEVLRQQGVQVVETGTFAEAEAVGADPAETTLLVNDPNGLLDVAATDADFTAVADRLVLIEPSTALLERYAPGVALAGAADAGESLGAECAVAPTDRAPSMESGDAGLQPSGDGDTAEFCYTDEDGSAQLAQTRIGDTVTTVLAASSAFSNENVARSGNAALILSVLGETPTLIWYEPGLGDITGAAPTTADLTPEWVSPVLLLLLTVFVAAAVWRGRRMGPLVVENLPVTVPAGETIEGRARLYRRSSARLHALDAIRMGTVSRLASTLRLSRSAPVADVSRGVAAATGRSHDEISRLLVDDIPGSDRELIDAAAALAALEQQVRSTMTDQPGEASR